MGFKKVVLLLTQYVKKVEKSLAFSGNTHTFHQINDLVTLNQPTSKYSWLCIVFLERAKLRDKSKKEQKFDAADQLIAEFGIRDHQT